MSDETRPPETAQDNTTAEGSTDTAKEASDEVKPEGSETSEEGEKETEEDAGAEAECRMERRADAGKCAHDQGIHKGQD